MLDSGTTASLEQIEVNPVGRKLPVIPLVVRLRPELEVIGIEAPTVVAAMPDHRVVPHGNPFEHTEHKPVALHLPATEAHLGRTHRVPDETARVGCCPGFKEGGDPGNLREVRALTGS